MPSVSLTLHQTNDPATVLGGAQYTVTNEIIASIGIDPAVFVFKTETGEFDRYATAADLDALPTSQTLAVVDSIAYYRLTRVTRVWTTISAMQDDLAMTRRRLNSLAREVAQLQADLTIDQTIEIKAG